VLRSGRDDYRDKCALVKDRQSIAYIGRWDDGQQICGSQRLDHVRAIS
jgi:hypothetical protein